MECTQEFAERDPDIAFIHAYPGAVRSSLMSSSESPLIRASSSVVMTLAYPLLTSVEDSGEYMLHGLLNATKGSFRVGSRGENMGLKRYFGSPEARKKLWEHTVSEIQVPA